MIMHALEHLQQHLKFHDRPFSIIIINDLHALCRDISLFKRLPCYLLCMFLTFSLELATGPRRKKLGEVMHTILYTMHVYILCCRISLKENHRITLLCRIKMMQSYLPAHCVIYATTIESDNGSYIVSYLFRSSFLPSINT